MNLFKKASLFALAALLGGALHMQAQSGPIPTNAYGYVPANPSPYSLELTQTDPTVGSNCYNANYGFFNYTDGTLTACVTSPGIANTATATYQQIAGTKGWTPGFSTVAAASTIAPTTRYVNLTGTTTVNTITLPSTVQPGAEITLICSSACVLGTSGNISTALTGTAGAAYPLLLGTDSKLHPTF